MNFSFDRRFYIVELTILCSIKYLSSDIQCMNSSELAQFIDEFSENAKNIVCFLDEAESSFTDGPTLIRKGIARDFAQHLAQLGDPMIEKVSTLPEPPTRRRCGSNLQCASKNGHFRWQRSRHAASGPEF